MRRNCRSFASLYIRPDDKPHDLEAQETRHRNGETEDFLLSIRTGNTHTRQARMSARKLIPREKSVTIRISTADAVNATTRIECEMKRISIALASKQDNISTRWYRSHDKLVPFEGHISVSSSASGDKVSSASSSRLPLTSVESSDVSRRGKGG